MTKKAQDILNEAVNLPPIERAELVEKILASFGLPGREAIDVLWGREAEDRIDAYERGEIRTTPAANVFDEIQRENPSEG
ncbi:MAG: addiction module protein [Candidatus Eisenbacteria sp.]|nr:addiction module protein [Candidatus Eisenbacteria bacterium]